MGEMPPNPSRLANGQAPQPFTTCKWTRPHNPSRLAPPPPPNPSRLANGQGLRAPQPFMIWGRPPNGQGLGALPTPICKWTRVGAQPFTTPPPNPSRLANGRVGGPPTLHDLQIDNGWTRVGATSTAFGQGLDPLNLSRFGVTPQINFTASTYVSKPTRRLVRRSTSQ